MKPLDQVTKQFILEILDQASYLSLATIRPDGYPQATTVTFARDDLTLYVSVGLDSQKAHNIQHNGKVSLTVNGDYRDWSDIRGLSMGGIASIVRGERQVQHAAECLLGRFPELKKLSAEFHPSLTEGSVFLQIVPQVISVIDYRKGFGHADLVAVPS